MKQEPTVSEETSFRYLKEKDINNPHFQIVCFVCDENHIESFRFGMIDLIKTACSDQHFGKRESYYYNQQQFVKLLELAYILKDSKEDLKLNADHPLYRFSDHPFELYTELKNKPFPALHFRTLSGTEIVTSDYVKKYTINERTARRDLIELVEKGILIRQGDKKSTKYKYL
jgi:catalase